MAEQVLKDVGIWIQGYSFAGVSNTLTVDPTAETPESTTFASGDWREYAEGGLKGVSFSLEGFFDEIDAQQFASLGLERSVMVAPGGEDPGDVAHVLPVRVSGHTPSGSVGKLLAFTYAAQGDGIPFRATVMDVRSGLDASLTTPRQDFGAIPMGHAQKVWVHVDVAAATGSLQVELKSADMMAGGTVTTHDTITATATGVYELTVSSGMLNPITDEYWFLDYTVTGAGAEFVAAAASVYGAHQIVIPAPPITPPPPSMISLRGGLSTDTTPQASELTIVGVAHQVTFQPFTNMQLLIARIATEPDIASVVLDSDPTMQNQIGGFTKFGSAVDVGGTDYNVWVSIQALTSASALTVNTA